MGDDQIAGRQALESAWKRASKDTWAFLRTPLFYVVELLITGAAVVLSATLIDGADIRIALPVIATVALPAIALIVMACRAPLVQRNEARKKILEFWHQQKPKLTISEAVVQDMPWEDFHSASIHDVSRVRIVNDSDAIAETCTASLLDIKPFVQRLDLQEGGRTIFGGNDFDGCPDIPFPISLSWSAHDSSNRSPSIDIPPRGDSLLDVCFYNSEYSKIALAFPSDEMRTRHLLPATDVVFSMRVDSKDCLPFYCVCRYRSNPLIVEIKDQCVIEYFGPDRPNLDDYRCFKETPRPPHWD